MKQTKSVMTCLGKQSMLFVAIVLATTIGEAAEGGRSVFSDAAVWIKGAYDGTGTAGVIDQGDLRHARDMSTAITGSAVYGGSINRQYVREDVLCPYTGTVISNVPCINLAQTVVDGKCNWTWFKLAGEDGPVSVTDCCATVVARIRPDVFTTPSKAYWLFGGMGFSFGFAEDSERQGLLRMRGYCGNWQNTDFYAEPGTWIDVAVVRENENGFRFYAVTNGVLFSQYKSATGISCGIKTDLYLGHNQKGDNNGPVDIESTSNYRRIAYRGLIQSFAVWNRQLTDAEIREAFAFPRADIARIGLADGAAGEFVKASPDGATVNANDWYGMPAALGPGEEVDIAFWLKDYEHSLPQVLRITAAAGTSANIGLSVSVNGSVVPKELQVLAGATKSLLLPGELFLSGSNTLHLANNSSGTVRFDALALGGSWQVGYEDDSHTELSRGTSMDVCDSHWLCKITSTNSTDTVTVDIPAEFVACGHSARFIVRGILAYGFRWYDPAPACELAVNGVNKGVLAFTDRYQTFTVKVSPGELRAGKNEFSFINRSAPWTSGDSNKKEPYILMDFWRLEVGDLPLGFILSFR